MVPGLENRAQLFSVTLMYCSHGNTESVGMCVVVMFYVFYQADNTVFSLANT